MPLLVGLPSWPLLFKPQHVTAPDVVSAQVWASPAAIATTLLKPATGCGAGLGLLLPLLVVLPSWPYQFKPQHVTVPAVLSAQV